MERSRASNDVSPSGYNHDERGSGARIRSRQRTLEDRASVSQQRRQSEDKAAPVPRQRRSIDVSPTGALAGTQRGWERDENEGDRQSNANRRRSGGRKSSASLQVVPVGGGGGARDRRDEYEVDDVGDSGDDDGRSRARSRSPYY